MTRDSMTLELPGTVPELSVLISGLCSQGPSDPPIRAISQTVTAEELDLQAFEAPSPEKIPQGNPAAAFLLKQLFAGCWEVYLTFTLA